MWPLRPWSSPAGSLMSACTDQARCTTKPWAGAACCAPSSQAVTWWRTPGSTMREVSTTACQRPSASGSTRTDRLSSPSITRSSGPLALTRPLTVKSSLMPPVGRVSRLNCTALARAVAVAGAGAACQTTPLRPGRRRLSRPPAPTWASATRSSRLNKVFSRVPAGRPVSRLSSKVSLSAVFITTSALRPSCAMRQAKAPGAAALSFSTVGVPRENSRCSRRSALICAMLRYSGAAVSKWSRPPEPQPAANIDARCCVKPCSVP